MFKQIGQNNQLPWTRSELFADGIIRSRGFVDVRLDFTDSMIGEVSIDNLNSKNVVIDPDAEEYDPDGWNDVFTTKWVTPQDVAVMYSEDDAEYLKIKDGSSFPYGYDSIERVRDRFGGVLPLAGYYGIHEPHGLRRNIRLLDRQYRRLDKQLHFVDVKTGDMRPVPQSWDRDRIASEINAGGVPCFQGSCSEVYLEKAFDNTGWRPDERLPVARELGETSLMFLVHPGLTADEIQRTCDALTEVITLAAA